MYNLIVPGYESEKEKGEHDEEETKVEDARVMVYDAGEGQVCEKLGQADYDCVELEGDAEAVEGELGAIVEHLHYEH